MPPIQFPEDMVETIKPILWKRIFTWQSGIIFRHKVSLSEKEIGNLITLNVNYFKCPNSPENRNTFLTLQSQFPDSTWQIEYEEEIETVGKNRIKGYHFRSDQPDVIAQITEAIAKGIQLVEHSIASGQMSWLQSGNSYFSREIHPNYLYEIALGRAQRIVWRNVLQVFKISNFLPPFFISILPVPIHKEQYLIEASTKILSAKLGGADIICLSIDDMPSGIPIEYIAKIFNILALETNLEEVHDFVAGSYYFDALTAKIAEEIWQQLKTRFIHVPSH
jgi:hypothetical protein